MSEANLLLYQVNVTIQVYDENNGSVYVLLLQEDVIPSTIQTEVGNHVSHLTALGTGFAGNLQVRQVSGTLTYTFDSMTQLTANIRSPIEPGVGYYMYVYAVDAYNNSVLVQQTEQVLLSTDSTSIHMSILYPLESPTGNFHEFRNTIDIDQPTITSNADMSYFGFFENRDNYENVLFANIFANPSEFVMDEIYSFAIENPPLNIEGNELKFMNLITNTTPSHRFPDGSDLELLFQRTESFPYEINTFYSNIDSNVHITMLFDKQYTLYHAFHLKSINKYIVQRSDTIVTGTRPSIHTSFAEVDNIEKNFIDTILVEENTSGSFKVTTSLNRSLLHENQSLYLYTASFGTPQYDHQALLANLNSHFVVQNTFTSTTFEAVYTTVQDAMYATIDSSLVNGIFVYQFASVGRNGSEISIGAPSSNLTDFNGGTLYINSFPTITSTSSNVRLFHYNDDFVYYIFKIRKDSLTNVTNNQIQSLVRNIHQNINRFDDGIIIHGYVHKGVVTNNIDPTIMYRAFENAFDYYDTFLLSDENGTHTETYIGTITTDHTVHVRIITL